MIYNSTIIPKNKKCKCGCNREGRIWANGMLKECNARVNPPKPIAKFSKKREAELEGGNESFQNLVNDLDRLFSLVVRIGASGVDGFCDCFTCGTKGRNHYKNMHLSHYIPRGNMLLRWHTLNTSASCPDCNRIHNDDITPYTNSLNKKNKGIVEFLESHRHIVHKWTLGELKEMRGELQSKLDLIMTKFNK